jgi:hypothetical protein
MAVLDSLTRQGLMAGGYPTVTRPVTLTGPIAFKRGDVIGMTDAGALALVDSTKTDGTQNAVGVICDDISVEDGATVETAIYVKGAFVNRFLNFGGSDTVEQHMRRMTEIGLIVKNSQVEGGKYEWQ